MLPRQCSDCTLMPKKRNRSIKRTSDEEILLHSVRQVNLMLALSDTSWSWFAMTVGLFWYYDDLVFLSSAGLTFTACGLLIFVEVFGVLNYLTRKMFFGRMLRRMKRKKTAAKNMVGEMRRFGWMVDLFWLPLLFLCCFYTADFLKTSM